MARSIVYLSGSKEDYNYWAKLVGKMLRNGRIPREGLTGYAVPVNSCLTFMSKVPVLKPGSKIGHANILTSITSISFNLENSW